VDVVPYSSYGRDGVGTRSEVSDGAQKLLSEGIEKKERTKDSLGTSDESDESDDAPFMSTNSTILSRSDWLQATYVCRFFCNG